MSLLLMAAGVANAEAAASREVARLTALPDSVPCVMCLDVRTGATSTTPVAQVGDSGAVVASPSLGSRLCVGAIAAVHSVVVADGDGGAYVTWVEPTREDGDLRLQRVGASGAVAPGWPAGGHVVCDALGSQSQPALARGADGGVWMAWTDHRGATCASVRVMHLDAQGEPASGWLGGGRPATTSTLSQSVPRLVSAADGRMWLVWQEGPVGSRGLRALVFESGGTLGAGWPDSGRVLLDGTADRYRPMATADASGGIVLAWHEPTASGSVAKLTRLGPDGVTRASWPVATLTGGGEMRLTALLADSGAVHVAWTSGAEDSVTARVLRLSGSGAVAVGWPESGVVLGGGTGDEPVLHADGAGGVYAAWTRMGARGDGAVALVRLDAAGAAVSGWPAEGIDLPDAAGDEHAPRLASAEGGVLVSWSRGEGAPGGTVLRSSESFGETLPELRASTSWPDLVQLEWMLAGAVPYAISVERRVEQGEWARLAALAPDAEGRMPLEDRDVSPGSRMTYRLRLSTPTLEATMPETEVLVPLAAPLALHRIRLEGDRLRAWFSLPSREEARLEVFDVQGRRVFRQSVRVDHAGESESAWPTPVRLRSGVWFARLTQGREKRGLRVVLSR